MGFWNDYREAVFEDPFAAAVAKYSDSGGEDEGPKIVYIGNLAYEQYPSGFRVRAERFDLPATTPPKGNTLGNAITRNGRVYQPVEGPDGAFLGYIDAETKENIGFVLPETPSTAAPKPTEIFGTPFVVNGRTYQPVEDPKNGALIGYVDVETGERVKSRPVEPKKQEDQYVPGPNGTLVDPVTREVVGQYITKNGVTRFIAVPGKFNPAKVAQQQTQQQMTTTMQGATQGLPAGATMQNGVPTMTPMQNAVYGEDGSVTNTEYRPQELYMGDPDTNAAGGLGGKSAAGAIKRSLTRAMEAVGKGLSPAQVEQYRTTTPSGRAVKPGSLLEKVITRDKRSRYNVARTALKEEQDAAVAMVNQALIRVQAGREGAAMGIKNDLVRREAQYEQAKNLARSLGIPGYSEGGKVYSGLKRFADGGEVITRGNKKISIDEWGEETVLEQTLEDDDRAERDAAIKARTAANRAAMIAASDAREAARVAQDERAGEVAAAYYENQRNQGGTGYGGPDVVPTPNGPVEVGDAPEQAAARAQQDYNRESLGYRYDMAGLPRERPVDLPEGADPDLAIGTYARYPDTAGAVINAANEYGILSDPRMQDINKRQGILDIQQQAALERDPTYAKAANQLSVDRQVRNLKLQIAMETDPEARVALQRQLKDVQRSVSQFGQERGSRGEPVLSSYDIQTLRQISPEFAQAMDGLEQAVMKGAIDSSSVKRAQEAAERAMESIRNARARTLAEELLRKLITPVARTQSVPAYRDGGSMVTPEPIVGMGTRTGLARFIVGEAGPEKLEITPMRKLARFAA